MQKVYVSPIAPVASNNHECIHARVVKTGKDSGHDTLFVPPFTPVVQLRETFASKKGDAIMPVTAHATGRGTLAATYADAQGAMMGVSLEGVDEGAAAETLQCPEAGGLPIKVMGQAVVAYPFNELEGIDHVPNRDTAFYGLPIYVYPQEQADFSLRGDPPGFRRMKMGVHPHYNNPSYKLGVIVGRPAERDGIEAHITVYLDPFGQHTDTAKHTNRYARNATGTIVYKGYVGTGFADDGGDGGQPTKKRRCMAPDTHAQLLRCCAAAATSIDGTTPPRYVSWLAPHGEEQVGSIDGLDVGLTFSNGKVAVPSTVLPGALPTPAQTLLLPSHSGDSTRAPSDPSAVQRQTLLASTAAFQHTGNATVLADSVHSAVSNKIAYAWGPDGSRDMLSAIAAPTVAAFALPDTTGKLSRLPATRSLLHDKPEVHDAIAQELQAVIAKANSDGWGGDPAHTTPEGCDAKTTEIRAQLAAAVEPLL